ncbi:hypothetical protein H257_15601 [Aphanomyces astaci]|uniref:U3 small nucleolar ribonucleoprotein protein MPP10 n=2 Tax=Aphanomyces astaci TaxID=112090 RepID=W4FP32_APHAT|nr:hypothetical protein H257_15601 [Aphanomyces astaci]ETV68438.1 hypothetical protein H257_15601 [Aphanomyces astaci]|eukprot:XP_009842064.1 hypothetical protein H257_15601 [Aphanomyces astaci]
MTKEADTSVMEAFRRNVLEKPEVFFAPSTELATTISHVTKYLYDQAKKRESSSSVDTSSLEALYVDGFDADQIWEQLKLQNEPLAKEVGRQIKKFAKNPSSVAFFTPEEDGGAAAAAAGSADDEEDASENEQSPDDDVVDGDDDDDDKGLEDEGDVDDDDMDDDDMDDDDDDELTSAPKKTLAKKRKRRDLEDGFFDWDEMEKAAEEEELNDDDDDEDGDENDDDDDDFEDEDDDGLNEKTATYKDLFDEPTEEGDEEDEEEEEEEEGEDTTRSLKRKSAELTDDQAEELAERGILSTHQRRSTHLHDQIKSLEDEALGDKPWALKGEVKGMARPENSLLEADLEYDRPTKVAPIITVEVTQELEELIKTRIRDENYDDVVRKLAVNDGAQKEAAELSMEKSKEGLGDVYEKEFMKSAMGFEDTSELKKEQDEIDVMFQKLCWKLDALTNFHYTPKPVVREMHVTPAAPAITMEEAVPIAVSDANLHAPEEVYDKKHKRDGVVRSREEMSQDERKAARNAKKHARRKSRQQKDADEKLVAKVNPGMGNKYEKKKLLDSLQAKNVSTGKAIEGSTRQFSNSSEFFSRLQDEQKAAAAGQPPRPSFKKDDAKAGRGGAFYKL